MKFNQQKCRVPHLQKNNPRHQYVLEVTQLKNCSAEENQGIQVGTKLNMN